MKIRNKRKLSTKRTKEAKTFLLEELRPHTWKQGATQRRKPRRWPPCRGSSAACGRRRLDPEQYQLQSWAVVSWIICSL